MPEITTSLRVPNYASAPTSPTAAKGHLYFDTTTNVTYYYNGAAWIPVTSATPAVAKVLFLTSGTTYTPTTGVRALTVECWGGGGGGGGAKGTASAAATGGGGGGGGYAMKYVTGAALKSSFAYAIGPGGAGGAITPAVGTDGTITTFDSPSICTATAGVGGNPSGTAQTTPQFHASGGGSSLPTVCDMGMRGGNGGTGIILSATMARGGEGGASAHGSGIAQNVGGASADGIAGRQYGGGGTGAGSTTATGQLGGAGAQGAIRITEYF